MAVTDEAIEQIKAMIATGALKPGDRLPPEKELSTSLGLSRNSLREAVKALTVVGVLDVRRGDGTYVTSLEPRLLMDAVSFVLDLHDDTVILDIFGVRRMLEAPASGIAAQRATSEDVAALYAEVDRVSNVVDVEQLVEHDTRFHRAIVALAGNAYLSGVIDTMTTHTVRARIWRGVMESGAIARTLAEHRAIVDAIAAGDAELAAAANMVHINGVERWLRQARVRAGFEPDPLRG